MQSGAEWLFNWQKINQLNKFEKRLFLSKNANKITVSSFLNVSFVTVKQNKKPENVCLDFGRLWK